MYDMSYDVTMLRHSDDDGVVPASAINMAQYPRTCRVFATIREPSRGTPSTVCGSQGRAVNVFTSDGDRIELRIMTAAARPASAAGAGGVASKNNAGTGAAPAAGNAAATQPNGPYFLLRYDGRRIDFQID